MKFDTKIELCEMPDEIVAGRAKIKMSALKVSNNDSDNNDNGINWVSGYVKSNIKSMIGASYKVAFIDDDKTYPSGHGSMEYDEDGNVIFPDSDTVGSIQDAYIETVDIDGKNETVLTTEGFIYRQSYPNFYNWLKEESKNGVIYGSVEINGKGVNRNIIYDGESKNLDGTPKIGRKPKIFDFTALAILSDFVPPADKYSRVLEVNSKNSTIHSEELDNSFNDKSIKNKEVDSKMDDNNVILELNQKIEDKTTEINNLTASNKELANKNAELNEVVVNANKSLEDANATINTLTAELNACKEELNVLKAEKEQIETEKKRAEVNSYFETEIPKNGFAEEEINTLKCFVEKVDLIGLKNAESELCAKKFKEMITKKTEEEKDDSEINSSTSISFITIHEKEKKHIDNDTISFFN